MWPDDRPRKAVLALKHPGALGRMFLRGTEVGLAEAYLHNDFDIEGDIEAAFEIGDSLIERPDDCKKKLKLGSLLITLPGSNGRSIVRSAANYVSGPASGCSTLAVDGARWSFTLRNTSVYMRRESR